MIMEGWARIVVRAVEIQAGRQTITAADPIPDDLRQALDAINHPG